MPKFKIIIRFTKICIATVTNNYIEPCFVKAQVLHLLQSPKKYQGNSLSAQIRYIPEAQVVKFKRSLLI